MINDLVFFLGAGPYQIYVAVLLILFYPESLLFSCTSLKFRFRISIAKNSMFQCF